MTRTFRFRNTTFVMTNLGRGQYTISAMGTTIHTTDSEIWDYCTDGEYPKRMAEVRKSAYTKIKLAQY